MKIKKQGKHCDNNDSGKIFKYIYERERKKKKHRQRS